MTQNDLESKLEGNVKSSYIEKLFDASGAAIGTGIATNALLGGAPAYATMLAYLIPYGTFKTAKYLWKVIKNPFKNLTLNGFGEAVYDTFANILPSKERVPAGVGVFSGSTNYMGLGNQLVKYLSYGSKVPFVG